MTANENKSYRIVDSPAPPENLNRNVSSGLLFGLGLVAFIDETVFHQLLHWHHFYDKSTTDIGLVSDGFFHAFSWLATIGGLFLLADLRRRRELSWTRWCGGVLLGGGLFQLYDGTVQHKLMNLHQIRYVENVNLYDWIWNMTAALMIVIGGVMLYRTALKQRRIHGTREIDRQ